MTSEITAAARRITREAGKHRAATRLYFDADGQLVEQIYGPEAFGPNRGTYAVRANGGHLSQAQAQARLDAYAAARHQVDPDDDPVAFDVVYGGLLQDSENRR